MFNIAFNSSKNIVALLQTHAVKTPNTIAYIFLEDGVNEKERINYFQLDRNARKIAAFLQRKKWHSERVLLNYTPGIEFISAFYGCLYAGIIPIPIPVPRDNTEKGLQQLVNVANHAGIVAVLTNLSSAISLQNIPVIHTQEIDNDIAVMYKQPDISEDDIAYLQYTSGSTSEPKAVILLHKNLLHNLKYTSQVWKYDNNSVMLTWAPHSHVYGLVCGLLVPSFHGSTGIIIPPQIFVSKPHIWLQAISKYKVTHSGCPNFGYELCVNDISDEDLKNVNLQTWKVAINGGENVRADTINKFNEKFSKYGFNPKAMRPVYGMSELSGTVAVSPLNTVAKQLSLQLDGLKNNRVIVSNGKLIPGIEAAVIDPETLQTLPANQIGEICLSGKCLAAGYYKLEEKTQSNFISLPGFSSQKTFFRTGDLGFIAKDEIFLTGRRKEIIVVYGKKYYPQDLESAVVKALAGLTELAARLSQAVFSVESNQSKEQIIFLQEIKDSFDKKLENAIIKQIRKTIAEEFSIDVDVVLLVKENSLPKTASGKLQRQQCKIHFLENKLEIVASHYKNRKEVIARKEEVPVNQSEFINVIANVLNINANEIDMDAVLSEFGFDSINIVRLTEQLNAIYNLHLTPARMFEYPTLKHFFDAIASENDSQPLNENIQIHSTPSTDDIAIIGMNGVFPSAENLDEFWENMLEGKDAISEIPSERWDWEAYGNIKWGGFVPDIAAFDADFFNISPREAELADPQQRIFLQVVWNAIEDAGYSTNALAETKTGLFVGVFNNDYAELLQKNNISDAYITTGITHSILANRVSYLLNFHGPSEAIDTACSSSLVAIHHAIKAIHNKDCNVAIVGGVNALLTPTVYLDATQAGMLSPDGRCKTFDKNANGYVRAEGMGAIILKPLADALQDGDHVYAVIKGSAINHGGHVSSLTVPNPNAQAEVITSAWERAGIPFDSATYIEAHGTGTSIGDPIEINGLKKAYQQLSGGKHPTSPTIALGSVKTHVGHLEAAAGIVGIIKILLALKNEVLPANLHFNEINPYIEIKESPFYILNKTSPWKRATTPRRAGISSFGFGGTNAHIVIEEAHKVAEISETAKPCLITLSAKTAVALQARIKNLHQWLLKNREISLAALSYTLNVGRNHFEKRCAFIVESISDLLETLQKVQMNHAAENFIINVDMVNKNKNKYLYQTIFPQLMDEIANSQNLKLAQLKAKLSAVATFYTEGFDVDFRVLNSKKLQRLSLPSYPFAKDHYWIPTSSQEEFEEVTTFASNENDYLPLLQQDLKRLVSTLMKLKSEKVNENVSLADFGFDSIAFKELAMQIENYFKITFTPSQFFSHNTLKTISEYIFETNPEEIKNLYRFVDSKSVQKVKKKRVSYSSAVNSIEPIAIIGIGGLFPQSKDLNEFWQHIEAGDDLVSEIPSDRWDWKKYYGDAKKDITKTNSKWGAYISDVDKFDAGFFNISAREANLMDPQQRLLLQTIWKAIEDAGIDPLTLSSEEIGLFVGVEFNDYKDLINAEKNFFDGYIATGTSIAMLANRISYFLNFHGPSEVVDTACSSSLVAINRAVNAIRKGECNLALAGGVSLNLTPLTFVITSQLGALSPDGRCKTFDKSANGYVKGEGVASILLKPLSKAEQDGNTIYGIIKSVSVNHGGKTQSLTAPNAAAQSDLIVKTYRQANIDPDSISYIEAHGTGTELGDPIEVEGLKQAFKQMDAKNKNFCAIGSLKTNIGHLEPASGIAGVIKVLLAMKNKKIPPLVHFKTINPYIDVNNSPFYFADKLHEWKRLHDSKGNEIPRRAGVSSFGFGGTNAHLVLEEYPERIKKTSTAVKPYYMVTFSARNDEILQVKIRETYEWLKQNFSKMNLPDLSYTLNTGRSQFETRCAFIVSSLDELLLSLQANVNEQPLNNYLSNNIQGLDTNSPVFNEIYKSTLASIKNDNDRSATAYREKLMVLGDLYVKGHAVDWETIHAGENNLVIAGLPTYPFAKIRYWIDEEIKSKNINTKAVPAKITPQSSNTTSDAVIQYLQNIFAEKLRIAAASIAPDATYEVYGVNSILVTEITDRLMADLGAIPKTILYEKNNLNDLAAYLLQKHKSKLQEKLSNSDLEEVVEVEIIENEIQEISTETDEDIAIVGLHGIYPQANTLDEFWNNLVTSKNCISEIPSERWNYKDYPVQVGGVEKFYNAGGFINDVDKFDTLFFGISPREAMLMDPQERLFMQSAWAALEDAGYTKTLLQQRCNNKVGVFAGVTYNFYPLFIADEWNKGNRLPLDIQNFSVANRISYFLNLNGPSYVVDTACSSSLAALHLACESLRRGECNMAIAGGVNLSLHPSKYHFLGGYSFLSDEGKCASFGEGGAGYVPSEGIGTAILKPLSLALRDHDHIYGVIKASHMNHGGKTSGYTVPNPNAQAALIRQTLDKAKINARTISYVEAHGTGTSLGDPIEVRGLQEAFENDSDEKQYCAIGSVKSNIGHAESAAGISQLTKVLLQLKNHMLVPSLHAEKLNPLIDFSNTPFYVQRELQPWQANGDYPLRAGISSFGAGGTNIHVIVEEYPDIRVSKYSGAENLLLVSALNEERLKESAQKLENYLSTQREINIHDVCYTLQTGRENFPARLALQVTSCEDAINKLSNFLKGQSSDQVWFNHNAISKNTFDVSQNKNIKEIGKAWVAGSLINWDAFYAENKPLKISLPTYPFAKRRCWITPEEIKATPKPDQSDWLYKMSWAEKLSEKSVTDKNTKHWIIFSDKELGFVLQDELGKDNCSFVFASDKYAEIDNAFYINTENAEEYANVLQKIPHENLGGVIYLWGFGSDNSYTEASYKMLATLQAILQNKKYSELKFCLVTRGSQAITDNKVSICQHHLWSMARIFAAENGHCKTLLLDLSPEKELRQEAKQLAYEIANYSPLDNHVAYRNNSRYAIQLNKVPQENISNIHFNVPEVALVTGGLGALGEEVTRFLIQKGCKKLLIIGNTELTEHSTNESAKEKFQQLNKLKQLATIEYAALDVSDKEKLQAAISQMEEKLQARVDSVFHLAGITTDSITIAETTRDLLQKVLSVKLNGSLNLHEIFLDRSLKHFVMFSSIASLPFFGMSGLSAYAMANEFMNGLAAHRRKLGLAALSIAWAAWAEKGMSHRYDHGRFLDAVGMSTISINQGMEILDTLLTSSEENVIVFKIQWEKFLKMNAEARKMAFFANFTEHYKAPSSFAQNTQFQDAEAVTNLITGILTELLQLEKSEVNVNEPYSSYGLDSIIGVNFVAKLCDHIPDIISPMDLYRYPTVKQLVDYVVTQTQTAEPAPVINQKNTTDVTPIQDNAVAIVGLSCRFPQAANKHEFWNLLCRGVNVISSCPDERWTLLEGTGENEQRNSEYHYSGGYLNDIDKFDAYYFGVSPREAVRMDPQQRILMEVSYDALEDAGIPSESLAGTNTGVFTSLYASQFGHLQKIESEMDALYLPTGNAISIAANRLSYALDLHGPSIALDSACSSSLVATHLACLHLQNNLCDLAIVTAANINFLPSLNLLLSQAHMLSPDGQCKTFDEKANGYVQGEGVGAIILKPLAKAIEDNDRIYAVIQGSAVNQDGKTNGLTAPSGLQQENVVKAACENAKINPEQISYVECHGTGTLLGDPIEVEALGNVLRKDSKEKCYIGSVKTNVGHLEPAAGVASLIKLALSLSHKQIPAHLNFTHPNSHIKFEKYKFAVPTTLINWDNATRYAGVSGFGFGGTNAHLILRNLEMPPTPESNANSTELFTLSAKNSEALTDLINKWIAYLKNTNATLSQICYNLHVKRNHYNNRIALVVNNKNDLINNLEYLLKNNLQNKTYDGATELEKLAKDYLEKKVIDWNNIEASRRFVMLDMPTYAWQHKSYWPEFSAKKSQDKFFEFDFDTNTMPEIQDTHNVLHAGYYLEMFASAVKNIKGDNIFSAHNLEFLSALFVPNNKKITVQLYLQEKSLGIFAAKFKSNQTLHATAELHLEASTTTFTTSKHTVPNYKDAKELYDRVTKMGMPTGNSIRWTKQFSIVENEIVCEFIAPETVNKEFNLGIHPGVIDGSIQPIFALLPEEIQQSYMASKMRKVTLYGMQDGPIKLIAKLHSIQAKSIISDWYLYAGDKLVIACEQQHLKQLESKIDLNKLIETSDNIKLDYTQNAAQLTPQIQALIQTQVASIFAMPEQDIPTDKSLRELGLDSLMALTLHSALTKSFSYPFENNFLTEDISINHLVNTIISKNATNEKANIWIGNNKNSKAKIRLFCFPYGGGGANIYANWQAKLDKSIEVCPIQLPGREIRLNEKPITNLTNLVNQLLENLQEHFNQPFALFGHSLGSLVSFELTRALRKYALPLPQHLFISAFPDPTLPQSSLVKLINALQSFGINFKDLSEPSAIENLSKENIKNLSEVFKANGLTEYGDHLLNINVLKALLPVFTADMSLIADYKHQEEAPLDVPFSVFHGSQDKWVSYEDIIGWKQHASGVCEFHEFPSTHLFLKDEKILDDMLHIITTKILHRSDAMQYSN